MNNLFIINFVARSNLQKRTDNKGLPGNRKTDDQGTLESYD